MSEAARKPKAKDVQRGIWNPETVAEVRHKADTGTHRIRGCGATKLYPNFDDLLVPPS